MTALTVWTNGLAEVRLHQLSDDHDKIVGYTTVKSEANTGTEEEPVFKDIQVPVYGPRPYAEQIEHLATLSFLEGWTCVSPDFTGAAPEVDPALWRWSNGQIVAVVPVPDAVTPRQVRLLLLQKGLLANVEAMIKASDQATQITWEFATEFRRDNPLLEQLAGALGLTDAQVDQFFVTAAEL